MLSLWLKTKQLHVSHKRVLSFFYLNAWAVKEDFTSSTGRDIVNNPAEVTGFGKVVCEWSGLAVTIHIKSEGKKPS